jgi:hypothetical protein
MADDDPDNDGIYFDAILNGVRARFFHREDNPPRSCPWCGAHHSGAQCPPDRESAEGRIRHMIDVVIPGQPRKIADTYRADLAKEINYWRHTRDWGPDVHRKMLNDPLMGPHLNEAAKAGATLYGMIDMIGRNCSMTGSTRFLDRRRVTTRKSVDC